MPFDFRGRMQTTLEVSAGTSPRFEEVGKPLNYLSWSGSVSVTNHVNEEFPVGACIRHPSLLSIEQLSEVLGFGWWRHQAAWQVWRGSLPLRPLPVLPRRSTSGEVDEIRSFRGSKCRNKVCVGEPAEGSLPSLSVGRRRRRHLRTEKKAEDARGVAPCRS